MSDFKVIRGQFSSFKEFIRAINDKSKKQSTLLIGIDGCGGSGKSTFADKMKEVLSDITIVHKDDFYLPSSQIIKKHPTEKPVGADFDWKRLLNQVLEPISQGREGQYQRYDWETDILAECHTVPVGGIVVVEGVYSIRQELENKYDIKIWIDCPREIRLSRGIKRDGEDAREMWEDNWMISEDIYMEEQKPFERADLVFIGTK
ncbi:MAG: uridine kinase family protein [Bacillota bacterium]|jgi:uridine kinase